MIFFVSERPYIPSLDAISSSVLAPCSENKCSSRASSEGKWRCFEHPSLHTRFVLIWLRLDFWNRKWKDAMFFLNENVSSTFTQVWCTRSLGSSKAWKQLEHLSITGATSWCSWRLISLWNPLPQKQHSFWWFVFYKKNTTNASLIMWKINAYEVMLMRMNHQLLSWVENLATQATRNLFKPSTCLGIDHVGEAIRQFHGLRVHLSFSRNGLLH